MMDIVTCTDRNYIMPTGVMICSVCVNNLESDIVFHIIIDEDVQNENRQDLEQIVGQYQKKSLVFYPITEVLLSHQFPCVNKRLSRTTYFRLYLTEILPPFIDKVLYLDNDIIVRHSLEELWNIDVSRSALAAIPDMYSGKIQHFNRLLYPITLGYFNAGVLLINLAYWKSHHVCRDFVDYIKKHSDILLYRDQDVLNVIFKDHKQFLPIKYNLQNGFLKKEANYDYLKYENEVLEARKDPVIIHYTGGKPWISYIKFKNPYSSSFYVYQDMTKWKGVKVDDRSVTTKIKTIVDYILQKTRIRPYVKNGYLAIDPID